MTDRLWIKTICVFCEQTNRGQAHQLMFVAVKSLMSAEKLRFEDDDDAKVYERKDKASIEWSDRPVFLRGNASDYSVMLDHFWKPYENYHYFVMSPESPIGDHDLSQEWALLLQRSRRLVKDMRPDAAFGWGRSGKADEPFEFDAVCTRRRPYSLAPWTYYNASVLDETIRSQLRTLQFAQDFADGVTISPVALPGTDPPPAVAAELQSITTLRYRDPMRRIK